MSALREWAATLGGEARKAVDVNAMGKWKTATQVGRDQTSWVGGVSIGYYPG
jgi:hypothetical protein